MYADIHSIGSKTIYSIFGIQMIHFIFGIQMIYSIFGIVPSLRH